MVASLTVKPAKHNVPSSTCVFSSSQSEAEGKLQLTRGQDMRHRQGQSLGRSSLPLALHRELGNTQESEQIRDRPNNGPSRGRAGKTKPVFHWFDHLFAVEV